MVTKNLNVVVEELSFEELPADQQELVTCAREATQSSYADYSKFNVGAAIRLSDGTVVKGANQENAAFTVGLCAERTAIYAAQAQYPEKAITAIAIAAKNVNGFTTEPVAPCGSCRQVMVQMEDRYHNNMTVLLSGSRCIYRINSAKALMPLYFVDDNMR